MWSGGTNRHVHAHTRTNKDYIPRAGLYAAVARAGTPIMLPRDDANEPVVPNMPSGTSVSV